MTQQPMGAMHRASESTCRAFLEVFELYFAEFLNGVALFYSAVLKCAVFTFQKVRSLYLVAEPQNGVGRSNPPRFEFSESINVK
jgi:hypothetical protein